MFYLPSLLLPGGELFHVPERFLLIEGHHERVWEEGLRQATGKPSVAVLACAAAIFAGAVTQTACRAVSSEAVFDRSFKVDGPVRLEVVASAGRIVVRRGAPGMVRVHGAVRANGFLLSREDRRAQEVAANPPIEQNGSFIRVGASRFGASFTRVSIRDRKSVV
jgi:hypothetical protein